MPFERHFLSETTNEEGRNGLERCVQQFEVRLGPFPPISSLSGPLHATVPLGLRSVSAAAVLIGQKEEEGGGRLSKSVAAWSDGRPELTY